MRLIFFSDAHGNQYAVRALFKQLAVEKPDLVVFGGDIFGYYYGQCEIISLLIDHRCVSLLGNHDQFFLDLLNGKRQENELVEKYGKTYRGITSRIPEAYAAYLSELNSRLNMTIDNLNLVFVHGSIENPLDGRIYPDSKIYDLSSYKDIDYVFMGHTHHKLQYHLSNGCMLINAGSIGQQRDGRGCTYVIFDTQKRRVDYKTVEFDKNKLVQEIKAHKETETMEKKLIEVLYRQANVNLGIKH